MFDATDISHTDDDRIINFTPRHQQLLKTICDLQPFYILEYMAKNGTGPIYDVGCGFNWFKNFYYVIGIDPNLDYADRCEKFNCMFAKKYFKKFDNVFSINAIHFCQKGRIANRMLEYFDLVKPGGYAYLAVNTARIYDNTYPNAQSKPACSEVTKEISTLIQETIDGIDGTLLLYEDRTKDEFDDWLNGNIRILIKR